MLKTALASLTAGLLFSAITTSAKAATTEDAIRVDRSVAFEEVCDQNHYLSSPQEKLIAAFRGDLVGARGPFGGHAEELAFAPVDCLLGPGTSCSGWTRVTAQRAITGVKVDEVSITIRVQGEGLYRIGLDGTAAKLSSTGDDPCRDVDFFIGGCALKLINTASPDWAFDLGPGVPRRQSFGFSAASGQAGVRTCTKDEVCRFWPMSEQVGLLPADNGRVVALANGRVILDEPSRRAVCDGQDINCPTGEFIPVIDAHSGFYLGAISSDGLDASPPPHSHVVNFAFTLPGRALTVFGIGDDAHSRRIVVRAKNGETSRTCPARPLQLPPFLTGARVFKPPVAESERHRITIGPASRRATLYVDHPKNQAHGTLVNFAGGPLSSVEYLRDAIDVTALNLGAIVVRPVVSGQDSLGDGAWKRLRLEGRKALESDIAALELELSDRKKYPRPLIIAANSFGALPLRLVLERRRLDVAHVILSIPMTAYRAPEDIIAAQEAAIGRRIADRARVDTYVKRNRLFAARAFGEGIERGRPFRTWIDAFDPCQLPRGSKVYLASNDTKVSWPQPSSCDGPDVKTFGGDHDLIMVGREYWTEIEKTLPAMLKQ